MTRGLIFAWSWRKAYWLKESPGVFGLSAFAALPLLFFLPLEKFAFFEERMKGVAILTWLFALALALAIRGGTSLRNETSIWTFQKGLSLGHLENHRFDLFGQNRVAPRLWRPLLHWRIAWR